MTTNNKIEIEIKLEIDSIPKIKKKLQRSGFFLKTPRYFERNIVFDDIQKKLRNKGHLLRLRQEGENNILTFKKKSSVLSKDYKIREEIEFRIEEFEKMQSVFEYLGFYPFFIYEKFREVYKKEGVEVMIDETPIGNYIEIEGGRVQIDQAADILGFTSKDYISVSYYLLFLQSGKKGNMLFNR